LRKVEQKLKNENQEDERSIHIFKNQSIPLIVIELVNSSYHSSLKTQIHAWTIN